MDLLEIRKEIDEVNRQMSELYDKREKLAQAVAECKKIDKTPILNEKREKEILDKWSAGNPFKRKFFMNIMMLSRNLQTKLLLQKNIVLIGMSGCGKSTIGRIIAGALDLPLKDMDTEIEKQEKMSINQIFAEKGEGYFRNAETQQAIKLSKSKKPCVIPTGGGVVLNEENMNLLKKTGIVFFIDRSPDSIIKNLNSEKRPLLKNDPQKLYEIYESRIDLYRKYADYTIEKNATPNTTAGEIINILQSMSL